MRHVLVVGAGKIGSLITCLLHSSGDYHVHLADVSLTGADVTRLQQHHSEIETVTLDINDSAAVESFLKDNPKDAVISSLPYYHNIAVAEMARKNNLHYFDLTEDVNVTQHVQTLAQGATTAFVPQCGLAPGFISIVAHELMQGFDELDAVKLRVGALPENTNNALQYSLTWSTDGVINEYGNPCHGIAHGKPVSLAPLEDLEAIQLDGLSYEAFNTSGGLGSLAQTYQDKVRELNYKTIRYPGHCEKMRVLMNDLRLNEDRDTLKRILEKAVPKTYQDLVLIYVSVSGMHAGTYLETNYAHKVYPHTVANLPWSAIQVTTAAGICTVVDLVLQNPESHQGLVLQEQFSLDEFLANRFGHYYAKDKDV